MRESRSGSLTNLHSRSLSARPPWLKADVERRSHLRNLHAKRISRGYCQSCSQLRIAPFALQRRVMASSCPHHHIHRNALRPIHGHRLDQGLADFPPIARCRPLSCRAGHGTAFGRSTRDRSNSAASTRRRPAIVSRGACVADRLRMGRYFRGWSEFEFHFTGEARLASSDLSRRH